MDSASPKEDKHGDSVSSKIVSNIKSLVKDLVKTGKRKDRFEKASLHKICHNGIRKIAAAISAKKSEKETEEKMKYLQDVERALERMRERDWMHSSGDWQSNVILKTSSPGNTNQNRNSDYYLRPLNVEAITRRFQANLEKRRLEKKKRNEENFTLEKKRNVLNINQQRLEQQNRIETTLILQKKREVERGIERSKKIFIVSVSVLCLLLIVYKTAHNHD